VDAVEDGFEVLILSDRAIDSDHAPIPSFWLFPLCTTT
jgi:glutamate synthase (NADPH/NADH) large chain